MSITQSIVYGLFSTNTSKQILPRSHTLIFSPISDIRVLRKHADTIRCLQYSIWQHNNKMKRNFVVSASVPPDPSSSSGGLPGGLPGSWKSWLLGFVVTVIIPLLTNRWGTLLNWTQKIESTIQSVEDMVEEVEEVAEKVDKFTEDLREDLPEGKLKIALGRVEQVAEKVAKEAKQMDNMIDKVQEVEEKLDTFIEAEQQRTEAAKKDKEAKDKK